MRFTKYLGALDSLSYIVLSIFKDMNWLRILASVGREIHIFVPTTDWFLIVYKRWKENPQILYWDFIT